MPLLAQQLLKRLQRGEDLGGGEATRQALELLREESRAGQRRLAIAVVATGLLITAGLLLPTQTLTAWVLGLAGLFLGWRAIRAG